MKDLVDEKLEQQAKRFIEDIENERSGHANSNAFLNADDALAYEEIQDVWDAADGFSDADIDELFEASGLTTETVEEASGPSNQWQTYLKKSQKAIYAFGALLVVIVVSLNGYFGSAKEYSVAKGQTLSVTFTDGSELAVSGNTVFSIREGWGTRSVTMERGNIFFSVAPNRQKAFVVTTPHSTISVLGTSFNVFSSEETDEVVVEHGRVKVENARTNDTTQLLKANEKAVVSASDTVFYDNVNVQQETSWREGIIQFENEELATVVQRMNDFYVYTLKVGDSDIGKERVSGTFSTNNVEDFISALKILMDVEVDRRTKGEIIIR